MKKSVAVTVGIAVIAGAWLGATWYTGKQLETETAVRIAQANEQLLRADPTLGLAISQVSHERGFFTSQARYAVTGKADEESGAPAFRLEFDSLYEHGPFPASALAKGRYLPQLAFVRSDLAETELTEVLFKAAQGKSPMRSELLMSYNGDMQTEVRLEPLKLEEDGDRFSFSGADLKGAYEASGKRTTGVFNAPDLSLDVDTERNGRVVLNIAGSQMDFDTRANAFDIQTGDVELRIDRFALRQQDEADVVIDKLVYGGNSTENGKYLKGQAYLRTGALAVNGYPVGSQSLTFKMDKLDGQALKRLSEVHEKAFAQYSEDGEMSEEQLGRLMDAVKALLADHPTLAIDDFSWTTDKGRSTIALHTELTPPTDTRAPVSVLVAQLFKSVRLDVNLNKPMAAGLVSQYLQYAEDLPPEAADAQAAQQADEAFSGMATLGLGQAEGDALKAVVEFDGERITVNGKELPPEVLLGLMMAM